ncbi:hypothetical protein V6N11_049077 [Hibiscus sabdariffa]|uniref:RNase H type-1 domain-containing protein n=1 Tax=Hibiscus sabdariffa TaxID=183260 RepID=A0ABR2PXJ8_9ROSI
MLKGLPIMGEVVVCTVDLLLRKAFLVLGDEILELNSEGALRLLQSDTGSQHSLSLLLHIGELRSRAWRVKSAHVRRGENKIVDSMAKLTSFDGCNTMQFSSPLVTDSSIMSFVIADAGD